MKSIPQWHDRTSDLSDAGCIAAMKAEITDLRAALAATAPESAPADAPLGWLPKYAVDQLLGVMGGAADYGVSNTHIFNKEYPNYVAIYTRPAPSHGAPEDPTMVLDPVVEANRALLHERSQVGIKKYGVTLGDAKLSERELIVHALQEALDLSNYLQANLQRLDAHSATNQSAPCRHRIADGRNPIITSGYLCIDCGALFAAADHDGVRATSQSADQVRDAAIAKGFGDGVKAALFACEDVLEELASECDSAVESGAYRVKLRLQELATSSAAKGETP